MFQHTMISTVWQAARHALWSQSGSNLILEYMYLSQDQYLDLGSELT